MSEHPSSASHEKAVDEINPGISLQQDTHHTRAKIALETLSRYADVDVEAFQDYILLTNFPHYVDKFAEILNVDLHAGTILRTAHSPEHRISIIDYRVGAPMAALIVDVISYLEPQCAIMLGLCGGLHRRQKVGDFLLPMAAIRDEGASRHYLPPQVPSLPSFFVQQFISEELMSQDIPFKTGVVHTTDYRMWEFDEKFIEQLRREKASAIDMECSALFTVSFKRKLPIGALMLVSDLPIHPNGIKTKQSARKVFEQFTDLHLRTGIDSVARLRDAAKNRHLNLRRFNFNKLAE